MAVLRPILAIRRGSPHKAGHRAIGPRRRMRRLGDTDTTSAQSRWTYDMVMTFVTWGYSTGRSQECEAKNKTRMTRIMTRDSVPVWVVRMMRMVRQLCPFIILRLQLVPGRRRCSVLNWMHWVYWNILKYKKCVRFSLTRSPHSLWVFDQGPLKLLKISWKRFRRWITNAGLPFAHAEESHKTAATAATKKARGHTRLSCAVHINTSECHRMPQNPMKRR